MATASSAVKVIKTPKTPASGDLSAKKTAAQAKTTSVVASVVRKTPTPKAVSSPAASAQKKLAAKTTNSQKTPPKK